MYTHWYFICFLFYFVNFAVKSVTPVYLLAEDGLVVIYDIKSLKKCMSGNERLTFLIGVSVQQCIRECSLRNQCKSLSYRRLSHVCELFLTSEEEIEDGKCIYMEMSDIQVKEIPCIGCMTGQKCNMETSNCEYKECQPATAPDNGQVLGTTTATGSIIRYKCNHGYETTTGSKNAVCLVTGQWDSTIECAKDTVCESLPTILHGQVAFTTGSQNNIIATVTCDIGYQSNVDVISCTDSGDWQNATCSPADCYIDEPWNYSGTQSVTETGSECQRWDLQYPRAHHFTDINDFPDSELSDARNYCRNPDYWSGGPWCFTADVLNPEWESCGITRC